jgi:LysR family nitrogen assimilation transcriptional regulator
MHRDYLLMDFKQLRTFLAIVETGNVTRAAELLHIVQPAVSRQLRLLEEDVGSALFDRTRRGMQLTKAGKTLVEYARRALNELDRARAEISPTQVGISGIVTIGLLPSTSDLLAGPLVSRIARKYPGVKIRIAVGHAGTLQTWLESGEVDVALLYEPTNTASILMQPLLEESMCVVGLPKHGLTLSKTVSLRELVRTPMILPSAPHGIRMLVDHACMQLGIDLAVVAETNAMSVQKSLVLGGHGVTILPLIAVAGEVAAGTLSAARLANPLVTRKLALAVSASRQLSMPVQHAITELIQCMQETIESKQWPEATWKYQN